MGDCRRDGAHVIRGAGDFVVEGRDKAQFQQDENSGSACGDKKQARSLLPLQTLGREGPRQVTPPECTEEVEQARV